jgi:hypothetical protein
MTKNSSELCCMRWPTRPVELEHPLPKGADKHGPAFLEEMIRLDEEGEIDLFDHIKPYVDRVREAHPTWRPKRRAIR